MPPATSALMVVIGDNGAWGVGARATSTYPPHSVHGPSWGFSSRRCVSTVPACTASGRNPLYRLRAVMQARVAPKHEHTLDVFTVVVPDGGGRMHAKAVRLCRDSTHVAGQACGTRGVGRGQGLPRTSMYSRFHSGLSAKSRIGERVPTRRWYA